MKKQPLKVAHNRPIFFQYCQLAQSQPKSQFLFHKNCSPRDLCKITWLTSDVSSYKRMKTAEDIILQSVINFIEIGVNYLYTQDVSE